MRVKYALNTETGENVAIKILDKDKIARQGMGEQIKKEIAVMKMVKQTHVVNLLEVLASRTRIFIVLELVTGGELFDKIVQCGRFDDATARRYFRQLVCGVEYCHRQGVCHRDLKPENLLLDENATLKISDFGLSALYGCEGGFASSTLLHTTCGTPNYVAPEVLADKGYDGFSADVWSCGVILYVLLAGFLPFEEPTMPALFTRIVRADFSYPEWFSPSVKKLISSILVVEPTKRATLAQIKTSEWFIEGGFQESDISVDVDRNLLIDDADFMDLPIDEYDDDVPLAQSILNSQTVTVRAPPMMNAFELVAMCGGLDLTPQLNDGAAAIRRYTRFHSTLPASEILFRLSTALRDANIPHTTHPAAFKVKVQTGGDRGPLRCTIQVFAVAPGLHLVDWRRGAGDAVVFRKFYEVMREQLQDLVAEGKLANKCYNGK